MRGATAFQWSRSLVYQESNNTAVFDGNVEIVHKSDDPKDEPAHFKADQVTAVFERRATKPTTRPATTQPAEADPQQLKWMTSRGHVSVVRAGSSLSADRIDYDPATQWITAIGTARNPAVFTDPAGKQSGSAELIYWNTKTWQVRMKNVAPGPRR
jgi:lipopolysaccharide assembly outer membrane protein LptD (OstA)